MASLRANSSKRSKKKAYPKPGPVGGRLIREVIKHLRAQGFTLPLDSLPDTKRILIATSGGADSTALAHLIARYGRKIVSSPKKLRFIHVNHGWRGQDSDDDAQFIRKLAKDLGAKSTVLKAKKPAADSKDSWENLARKQRKRFFRQQAEKHHALVLTAHQADDVAETVLWRVLTGQAETHSGGIAVRHGNEVRPLLTLRKKDLKEYLKEEGQEWREDATNHGGRFLRSRLRLELMPILEHIFPKAVDHLCEIARKSRENAQKVAADSAGVQVPYEALFGAAGLALRRPHWEALRQRQQRVSNAGPLALPGGWFLMKDSELEELSERWILQKDKPSEA